MAASHAAACFLLPCASSPAVSCSWAVPSAPGAEYCRDMPVARAAPPAGGRQQTQTPTPGVGVGVGVSPCPGAGLGGGRGQGRGPGGCAGLSTREAPAQGPLSPDTRAPAMMPPGGRALRWWASLWGQLLPGTPPARASEPATRGERPRDRQRGAPTVACTSPALQEAAPLGRAPLRAPPPALVCARPVGGARGRGVRGPRASCAASCQSGWAPPTSCL